MVDFSYSDAQSAAFNDAVADFLAAVTIGLEALDARNLTAFLRAFDEALATLEDAHAESHATRTLLEVFAANLKESLFLENEP